MTDKEFKNLKTGETFTIGCKKFVIKDGIECGDCDVPMEICESSNLYEWCLPECRACYREDRKDVVFKAIEEG